MKKNAASACQEKSGAAFAAFQANLKLLLERNSMSIVTTAGLSEEGVYQDLFLLWESALQTYFENLPRAGILLSSSTSALWLSKALSIEFDIAFLPGFCSGGLSEVGRPFLDYAQQFFPAFFAAAYAQPSEAGENLLPKSYQGFRSRFWWRCSYGKLLPFCRLLPTTGYTPWVGGYCTPNHCPPAMRMNRF